MKQDADTDSHSLDIKVNTDWTTVKWLVSYKMTWVPVADLATAGRPHRPAQMFTNIIYRTKVLGISSSLPKYEILWQNVTQTMKTEFCLEFSLYPVLHSYHTYSSHYRKTQLNICTLTGSSSNHKIHTLTHLPHPHTHLNHVRVPDPVNKCIINNIWATFTSESDSFIHIKNK